VPLALLQRCDVVFQSMKGTLEGEVRVLNDRLAALGSDLSSQQAKDQV
jgi:hypothetical protein